MVLADGSLSDYERQRLERIARNNAYLESLGLRGQSALNMSAEVRRSRKKRARVRKPKAPLAPSRKSARVAGKGEGLVELSSDYDEVAGGFVPATVDQSKYTPEEWDEYVYRRNSSGHRSRNIHVDDSFRLDCDDERKLEDMCKKAEADDSAVYLDKLSEFLTYHNACSEANVRSVMRQARLLFRGEGISYKWWPAAGRTFKKGVKFGMMSDLVELLQEAQEWENKWGKDKGNGWLMLHPIKKMMLFQQFCLNNPTFMLNHVKYGFWKAKEEEEEEEEEGNDNSDEENNGPRGGFFIGGAPAKEPSKEFKKSLQERKSKPSSERGENDNEDGKEKAASTTTSTTSASASSRKIPAWVKEQAPSPKKQRKANAAATTTTTTTTTLAAKRPAKKAKASPKAKSKGSAKVTPKKFVGGALAILKAKAAAARKAKEAASAATPDAGDPAAAKKAKDTPKVRSKKPAKVTPKKVRAGQQKNAGRLTEALRTPHLTSISFLSGQGGSGPGAPAAGAGVKVRWNDGVTYPGTVLDVLEKGMGRFNTEVSWVVAFEDGSEGEVNRNYLL